MIRVWIPLDNKQGIFKDKNTLIQSDVLIEDQENVLYS